MIPKLFISLGHQLKPYYSSNTQHWHINRLAYHQTNNQIQMRLKLEQNLTERMKWPTICFVIVLVLGLCLVQRGTNNVCKTFQDYYTDRDSNENCYYNPDHELQVPDIIRRHGYPVETHNVTTEDGYILTVFRIPHGRSASKKPGKPVFIQHGSTINSGAFVVTGRKSLGFVLADAGYDVWLGNFRGSVYSRNHTHLEDTDSAFWDFTFHELGVYDLPAQLNHVHEVTKQKITYVGFSMGSTASYIYGVTYPDAAHAQVERFISLAPIAFMSDVWFFKYISHLWFIVRDLLQVLTKGKLIPSPPLPDAVFKLVCLPYPFQTEMCQILDMMVFGYNYEQNDPETLPVTIQHNKDYTSVKTITHFTQLITSGNFQYFDYGSAKNTELYGSAEPPHYDLSLIKVPTYLIRAPNDWMSTKENVEKLQQALASNGKPCDIYVIKDDKFNHLDFFTGKDAVSLVYKPLVNLIDGN